MSGTGPGKEEAPLRAFRTARAFETWMEKNHARSGGIRLRIAKKGSGIPSVSYAEAVEIALCYGWIDGQARSIDESWYWQRFTPRRRASLWSKRNRERVARLIEEGRMRPAGQAEIDRAKADGRWDAAYDSPATAQVPPDLAAALERYPRAGRTFRSLDAANRYAVLHRLMTARKPETRAKRLHAVVQRLREGGSFHPQATAASARTRARRSEGS